MVIITGEEKEAFYEMQWKKAAGLRAAGGFDYGDGIKTRELVVPF